MNATPPALALPRPAPWRVWVQAARPRTLPLAIAPVVLGGALAFADTMAWPDPLTITACLTGALLIQIGTNLHNDAMDFRRGADTPLRLGPVRVCAAGWARPESVLKAALLAFGLAALAGLYLIWRGGWPILALGVASILSGLAYTAGPRPIAYSALGEVFVVLFFGLGAVAGTHYLLTGTTGPAAWGAGLLAGLQAAAVLTVNNFRDIDTDRAVGKRTLAVRLGKAGSRRLYAGLLLAPYPLLGTGLFLHLPWPALALPVAAAPAAWRLWRRLQRTPPGPGLNAVLAATARQQMLFTLLMAAGLILAGSLGLRDLALGDLSLRGM